MNIVWRRLWAPDGRDPAWMSDGVTKRPALVPGRGHLVVHYAGAGSYLGKPVLVALIALFRWAFGAGKKGDEYNYIITWDGQVWEWAGRNRAAHCSYWNDGSIGVLFMLGPGEAPTLEMIAAFLNLRRHLVDTGALTPDHRVGPHYEYLGTQPPGGTAKDDNGRLIPWGPKEPPVPPAERATGCWGDEIDKRRPLLVVPLPPPVLPKPPQPIVNQEDAVFWKVKDHPDYRGLAVIFQEVMPDLFVHIGPTDAGRYAGRAGTTVEVWAESQQPYPGGWEAFKLKFFPRA